MCRNINCINKLTSIALLSPMSYKHSAGILIGGKMDITGYNYPTNFTLNCHAEQSALMNLIKKNRRRTSPFFNFNTPITPENKSCFIPGYTKLKPPQKYENLCYPCITT